MFIGHDLNLNLKFLLYVFYRSVVLFLTRCIISVSHPVNSVFIPLLSINFVSYISNLSVICFIICLVNSSIVSQISSVL